MTDDAASVSLTASAVFVAVTVIASSVIVCEFAPLAPAATIASVDAAAQSARTRAVLKFIRLPPVVLDCLCVAGWRLRAGWRVDQAEIVFPSPGRCFS
jgi:hypothetical protein